MYVNRLETAAQMPPLEERGCAARLRSAMGALLSTVTNPCVSRFESCQCRMPETLAQETSLDLQRKKPAGVPPMVMKASPATTSRAIRTKNGSCGRPELKGTKFCPPSTLLK